MELSYGWTSYLAQDPRDQPAQTELKALRARPVLKGQQVPRAPQARRAPQALKAQPVKMPIRLSSIPKYKQISLSWLTGQVRRSQTVL